MDHKSKETIAELEEMAYRFISGTNEQKKVASILYSICGAICGGQLDQLGQSVYETTKVLMEQTKV